ncbi:MAG: hypothetical protein AAFR81_06615 [Chloroflexota bacterium]
MSVNDMMPQDNLPEWMKRAQRPVDWGALLMIAFCLLASFSFINQYTFPATNNSEHYAFQTQDFVQAFDEGLVYTRWSPYALHGYGAPIQQYYPPGVGYISSLLSYFFTNDIYLASRVLIVASFLLAGSTMYTFVKQEMDALAGLIAGCAYVFSPAVMVTIPHIYGDLPLVLGTALIPTMMWAVSRFWHRNLAVDFPIVACVTSAILLTSPALLIFVLIVVAVLLCCYLSTEQHWWRVGGIWGAIIVGIGLSAFYWLPAWYMLDAVTWYPSFLGVRTIDISWQDYFAILVPIEGELLVPQPIFALGWGFLGVLGINLVSKIFQRTHLTLTFIFLLLGIVLLGVATLPTMPSWFLLPALLMGIFCTCISASTIITHQSGILWTGLGCTMLIVVVLNSLPVWLLPETHIQASELTTEARLDYEANGYGVSSLPAGASLPSNLSPDYARTNRLTITRSDNSILRDQEGTSNLSISNHSAYSDTFTLLNTRSRTFSYPRAYFDNWQVFPTTSDIQVSATNDNLLQIEVPANTDTAFTVRMGTTQIQLISWLISVGALLIVGAIWWWRWQQVATSYDDSSLLTQRQSYIVIGILIFVVIARSYANFLPDSWTSSPADNALTNITVLRADIDRQFELIGFDLPEATVGAGDTLKLITYWGVIFTVDEQYVVQLTLRSQSTNAIIMQSSPTHVGHFPTSRWLAGVPVHQAFSLHLPSNITPDTYRLVFDIYECNLQCNIYTVTDDISTPSQISIPTSIRVE